MTTPHPSTASLETLWHEHSSNIYGYIYKTVHDHAVTEDLLSTVYLRAAVAISNGNGPATHEVGWLYAVTRNMMTDHWRAMHRVEFVDIEAITGVPVDDVPLDEQAARWETAQRVHRAIGTLQEEQQQVVLRYMEGYNYSEIAAQMDKQHGAVKAQYRRGLVNLRAQFDAIPVPASRVRHYVRKPKYQPRPRKGAMMIRDLLLAHGPMLASGIATHLNKHAPNIQRTLQRNRNIFVVIGHTKIQGGTAYVWGVTGIHKRLEAAA